MLRLYSEIIKIVLQLQFFRQKQIFDNYKHPFFDIINDLVPSEE